jgi:hypothetical protein
MEKSIRALVLCAAAIRPALAPDDSLLMLSVSKAFQLLP